ncbi:MAG: lytic transglycosylase domain-containing protein, partial [Gammaproteobacteria bacterium]|nr:lytic transglycosylase domain-containing protein [Gammaproteobacteria bacterium]
VGDLISHGVRRLMLKNPADAVANVSRFRRLNVLDPDTGQVLMRDIAIAAAKQRAPDALKWMAEIPRGTHDDVSRTWQAEAALVQRDWETLAAAVDAMSRPAQKQPKWRYWRAQAFLETGDRKTAEEMLTELAGTRHYYGFMAADRLHRPYAMDDRPTDAHPDTVAEIASRPGIRMARELRAVGDELMARRQWRWATRAFSDAQLRAASVLAYRWDWHDRAILDAARSGHREDLAIRFPVVHRTLVERYARVFAVDSSLIFSVIRQESAFMVDAVSSAGALGLMQLMPGTGRRVARRLKWKINTRAAILKVENNIQLGSRYLRQMLDAFGDNPVLAAAAYNAGPYQVRKWIPNQRIPTDLWIETIPFDETRSYVKNVLAFMMVYDYRLGRPARRITSLMGSVSGAAALASTD